MQDYRDLKVWERSHQLAKEIYHATRTFPKSEEYGLTSQIRRAAVSIPTNIAEGCGRRSRPELANFLQIAMGSASELEYLILFVKELDMLSDNKYDPFSKEISEIKRMLASLIITVRAKANSSQN